MGSVLKLLPPEAVEAGLAPFVAPALADGVDLPVQARTQWFLIEVAGAAVGTLAVMWLGKTGRLKGIWLDPAHRRQGLGARATIEAMRWVAARGGKAVEAVAYHPEFYLRHGFAVVKWYAHGALVRRAC